MFFSPDACTHHVRGHALTSHTQMSSTALTRKANRSCQVAAAASEELPVPLNSFAGGISLALA